MITITCTKKFEDTKGAIRIQHNGQKKKYKRTNNDLQNIYKTKEPMSECHGFFPKVITSI